MSTTPQRSNAQRDLTVVVLLVGVFAWLSIQFEFSENVAQWLRNYERFQLDEMPLTLLVLSLCLAWFAFRRIREVSTLLAANRDLTQRLITSQEDERHLLAQELHDEVGQACTALRIEAAYIAKVIRSDPNAALAAAQRIDESSRSMHRLARDILKRLRPPNLDSLGLQASLHELCRSWQQHRQIACYVSIDALHTPLPDPLAITLYRVTQEALTNITQHAHASQVWVSLTLQANVLTLTITDNGRGLPASGVVTRGLGLAGMRERVAALHGHIHFEDAQPGVRIGVQVPLPPLPEGKP